MQASPHRLLSLLLAGFYSIRHNAHRLEVKRALEGSSHLPGAPDELATCSENGFYCAEDTSQKSPSCPRSRCLPCNSDPDGWQNSLSCKACSLDSKTRLPMCTRCDGGLVSLAFGSVWAHQGQDTRSLHKRWLCNPSGIQVGRLPGLCLPDKSLQTSRRSSLPQQQPSGIPARSFGEWWSIEKNGEYVQVPVSMKVISGQVDHDYPEELLIAIAIFPPELALAPEADWSSAERVLAFKLKPKDHWVRSSGYLSHLEEPSDDEQCVWYMAGASENIDGQLELELSFVKHVVNPETMEEITDPPKLRIAEPAVQALGACFDYWIKGRLPRKTLSKMSEQMFVRARMLIESGRSNNESSSDVVSHACGAGTYCTFGPPGERCDPPGRCLPCHLDGNEKGNGLLCSKCALNFKSGGRYSSPQCTECELLGADQPDAMHKLKDETGVRFRSYCRPDAYVPGQQPGLCDAPSQGAVRVASLGEHWYIKSGNWWDKVLVRLLPMGRGQAYLLLLPDTKFMMKEAEAHNAGASTQADQMLMFNLGADDAIALPKAGFLNIGAHSAIFNFLGVDFERKDVTDVGEKLWFKLEFNKEVTDERGLQVTKNVVKDPPTFSLGIDSLVALSACIESIQKDHIPESRIPPALTKVLQLAKAKYPTIMDEFTIREINARLNGMRTWSL